MRLTRTRLTAISPLVALSTAIAVVIVGIATVVYEEHAYEVDQRHQATVQADILAATLTAALAFNDREAAEEYIGATKANPRTQSVAVYDGRGALFTGYTRSPAGDLPKAVPSAIPELSGGRIAVLTPVKEGDTALGTVYYETSTEPLTRRLARYGMLGLLVVMATLIFSVLSVAQAALNRQAASLAEANENLRQQIERREKVEAALHQAQKMEAIGRLTGGVAHDFNNLLQVILGNVEALRRLVSRADVRRGDENFLRMADAVAKGADQAATLTQRLLAFSRRQPLAPRPMNVNKLLAGMTELLRRSLGEDIAIETVLAGGLWRISADANHLESAILNLAVNARDAMPGGGKLTIETSNAFIDEAYAAEQEDVKAGQYVLIAVTDSGTGMTRETLDQAFEPFFTTKDVGKGTGLGLSQVYGFVKQSGGHAKIYSEVGQGTTVKLYLPRLAGAAADRDQPAAPQVPVGAQKELILVVEDNEDVRSYSVQILCDLGYTVAEAADGPAALQLLSNSPAVRLLFTDVGLPGMNGRQLAEEALKLRPDLRVLFTTGYARNAIVHHGRLDAGVELISKPFTAAALAKKIREVLDRVVSP